MVGYRKFTLYVPDCLDKKMLVHESPVFSDSVHYVMVEEVVLDEGSLFVADGEGFVFRRDKNNSDQFLIVNMSRPGYRAGVWFLSHSDAVAKVKDAWRDYAEPRREAMERRRLAKSDKAARELWYRSGLAGRVGMKKVYLATVEVDGESRGVGCDADLDLVAGRLIDIEYGYVYSIRELILGADGMNMYRCDDFIVNLKHSRHDSYSMLRKNILWEVEKYKKQAGYE